MREIRMLVVHCSASPDWQDIGFKEINEWHLERGWKSPSGIGCGYHFIIRRDGTVETGRPVKEIGAHVEGANKNSIGICLVGTHEFAEEQFEALRYLYADLHEKFPAATVHEHREFDSAKRQGKTCPNFDVRKQLGITA